jgi:hypothetical protein
MSERSANQNQTVIDEIQRDHREIETMLDRVAAGSGAERSAAFAALADHLAKHEAAEQAVVRPEMDEVDADEAEDRDAEESTADAMIAQLRGMDPDSAEFEDLFATFRQAVLEHAQHEETEEHPELEANVSTERLVEMADEFVEAENQASG